MIRYVKDGITYLLSKKTNTASILTISSDNDVIIIPKVIKRYFTTYNIKSINNNLFLLNKATQIIFEEDSNKEEHTSYFLTFFCAPEIYKGKYSCYSDIYSIGKIIEEIMPSVFQFYVHEIEKENQKRAKICEQLALGDCEINQNDEYKFAVINELKQGKKQEYEIQRNYGEVRTCTKFFCFIFAIDMI